MSKSSKRRVAALFSIALSAGALLGLASPASAAGNSANAKLCQKGGWETLVRDDQSSFKNQGQCVAYVAQGGTPSPKGATQILCESFGGTLGQTPHLDEPIVWSCDNWTWTTGPEYGARISALVYQCFYGEGPQGYGAHSLGDAASPTTMWCTHPRV